MFTKLLVGAAGSMIALSAFAVDANQVEKSVQLRNGSTVHVFADGKMGMEDKFGRAISMEPGQVMETKDGGKVVMNGNEIWRVSAWLNRYTQNG